MALMDGKSSPFGTLAPFGMWNRLAQPNDTIWLVWNVKVFVCIF